MNADTVVVAAALLACLVEPLLELRSPIGVKLSGKRDARFHVLDHQVDLGRRARHSLRHDDRESIVPVDPAERFELEVEKVDGVHDRVAPASVVQAERQHPDALESGPDPALVGVAAAGLGHCACEGGVHGQSGARVDEQVFFGE